MSAPTLGEIDEMLAAICAGATIQIGEGARWVRYYRRDDVYFSIEFDERVTYERTASEREVRDELATADRAAITYAKR